MQGTVFRPSRGIPFVQSTLVYCPCGIRLAQIPPPHRQRPRALAEANRLLDAREDLLGIRAGASNSDRMARSAAVTRSSGTAASDVRAPSLAVAGPRLTAPSSDEPGSSDRRRSDARPSAAREPPGPTRPARVGRPRHHPARRAPGSGDATRARSPAIRTRARGADFGERHGQAHRQLDLPRLPSVAEHGDERRVFARHRRRAAATRCRRRDRIGSSSCRARTRSAGWSRR